MEHKETPNRIKISQQAFILLFFIVVILISGCSKPDRYDRYQHFSENSWDRFKKVKFGIPVKKEMHYYDLVFYAYLNPGFEHKSLDINVIINSPSGEERIMEYMLPVRTDNADFFSKCKADSCIATIYLKRSLYQAKTGILTVEIENLIPRLKTEGINGIGISLIPVSE